MLKYLNADAVSHLRNVDDANAALPILRAARSAGGRTLIAAVPDSNVIDHIAAGLEALEELSGIKVKTLIIPEAGRGKLLFPGAESRRARALDAALREHFDIVLASCHALLSPAPAPEESRSAALTLAPGVEISPTDLAERLVTLDYDDEYETTITGEFSRRGGILDLYSPAHDFPCRVEFFGNTIDSLRSFDPATQRSTGQLATYDVIGRSGITAGGAADSDALAYFSGRDYHLLSIYPAASQEILRKYAAGDIVERFDSLLAQLASGKRVSFFCDAAEAVPEFAADGDPWQESGIEPFTLEYQGDFDRSTVAIAAELAAGELKQRIASHLSSGGTAVAFTRQQENLGLLKNFLRSALGRELAQKVETAAGKSSCSFIISESRTLFLAESTLLAAGFRLDDDERENAAAGDAAAASSSADIQPPSPRPAEFSLADLEEGDYVVHLDHGIGIFRGIRKLVSNNVTREVLTVEYRDGQLLYVPLMQAHKLSRYLGAVGRLTLHAIGGKRWDRDKESARGGVRSYAAEMLRFQAMRQAIDGISFRENPAAMQNFLRAFPFPDTPDQRRATDELKQDMLSNRPMDRLLCGDVGYGKTEIAMRAAFRAVSAGYQVAVLAPTTVLAQQHYRSFATRFAGFSVSVGLLSRMRSTGEQNRTISQLGAGKLDIVIGTHRLCSASVNFKNLGLVIIDEEQRFGVEHKERLRRFRAEADVLAMSATPIPRTLYLAMAGARDLSTLMTPPKLRLPVKTVIAPQEDKLIISAIKSELARGGQVYYLHNRVKTIDQTAEKLHTQLPDARFAVAHGQMPEHELEEIMDRFIAGAIDVLVCSTIIESGLDVPNANTMIIERADRFGLAELYQLRGRVGRWKRQAYAYMLLPKHELVSTDARKRLAAIRRCSNLGAGFQLALRDLEIRGSGNLLGSEQSGHLNAIGFDLYCQLLSQEINRLQGSEVVLLPEVEPAIDFVTFALNAPSNMLGAAFPPEYIGGERLRIAAYRKLASLESERALDDFRDELADRFGPLPQEAENLLLVNRLKLLAALAGYRIFTVVDGRVTLRNPGGVIYRLPDGKAPFIDYRDPPQLRMLHLLRILRGIK